MILPFQTVNHACDKLRVCRTVSTFPVVSKHHALLSDISLFPARMNGMPDCMLYSAGARPTFFCDAGYSRFVTPSSSSLSSRPILAAAFK